MDQNRVPILEILLRNLKETTVLSILANSDPKKIERTRFNSLLKLLEGKVTLQLLFPALSLKTMNRK